MSSQSCLGVWIEVALNTLRDRVMRLQANDVTHSPIPTPFLLSTQAPNNPTLEHGGADYCTTFTSDGIVPEAQAHF